MHTWMFRIDYFLFTAVIDFLLEISQASITLIWYYQVSAFYQGVSKEKVLNS
jgi:hypothetical protein